MSGVEIRKRANEKKRGMKKKKIARFHFLSNENLFLPFFSFHPGVFLILCKGGNVAFEFQVCCNTYFVGNRGKVLICSPQWEYSDIDPKVLSNILIM